MVPPVRIRRLNDRPVQSDGTHILYWMTSARRTQWNFGLQRAAELAIEFGKPLLVFEALRIGYPWASDRLHRFVIDGMRDNAKYLAKKNAHYFPYIERSPSDGKGLLAELGRHAVIVIGDDYPAFFLPRMLTAAAEQLPVRLEVVDSNGMFPMHSATSVFPTAYAFRRFLQKNLPGHLTATPTADPISRKLPERMKALPSAIVQRWPAVSTAELDAPTALIAALPIDHDVPSTDLSGGAAAAQKTLQTFLRSKLPRYADERNQPELDVSSGLSPFLHFGQIGVHQVFAELMKDEEWSPADLASTTSGSKEGWWNVSPAAESFLDELITWREVGFNFCSLRSDYDRYESLPDWAKATLAEHARDKRAYLYSLAEFEAAATYDELWNAAQRQLVREGKIHNYLRMLWGKKILEWSKSPEEALETMLHLNNKYALDGRDPNSYSGIFWVLGRYDHPWGPERPIFGKIRYMSSENTARKVRVREYLERYSSHSNRRSE